MARRLAIPSQHVELVLVGPKASFKAARVQRLSLNTDIPTTDVGELGNANLVGVVRDTPNVTAQFSAYDVGIKNFATMTGVDPDAYPAAGVNINQLGEMDAIIQIKDESVAKYVKTAHAKRLQIRDFSFSYSADGESTEDYTAVGSEKRWFKQSVIVDRFTSGSTSFTLTQTPVALKNGRKLLTVILDGKYLDEVDSAPATGQYSVSGTTLTTSDTRTSQCIAIYHAAVDGTWSDVAEVGLPAAIRGRDVKVTIAANSIPRVQNVTINGNLNVQPVREMGSRVIAGYQRQVPTVEGTITVLDTDTELIELLTTGTTGVDSEFQVGDGCPGSGINLTISLVDPCDTEPATVLKTVVVSGLLLTGESYTSNYNQNASQTFNWRSGSAVVIVYSGSPA
jgi:hypothetical protein